MYTLHVLTLKDKQTINPHACSGLSTLPSDPIPMFSSLVPLYRSWRNPFDLQGLTCPFHLHTSGPVPRTLDAQPLVASFFRLISQNAFPLSPGTTSAMNAIFLYDLLLQDQDINPFLPGNTYSSVTTVVGKGLSSLLFKEGLKP